MIRRTLCSVCRNLAQIGPANGFSLDRACLGHAFYPQSALWKFALMSLWTIDRQAAG